jgi:hypothetical protein
VPVFSVGDPPEAVVLAGAVSSGRLIVLGDPSVLINNMMQFRGNKRFALNLLQYLTSNGGSGKVYLMLPEATLHGRFGTLNADRPLERTRLALTRATALDLPDVMVRMLAGAIAAILLLFARPPCRARPRIKGASSCPRRPPSWVAPAVGSTSCAGAAMRCPPRWSTAWSCWWSCAVACGSTRTPPPRTCCAR